MSLTVADTTSATSPSASSPPQNVVSWQSAFWALVPIALNSMSQPSAFDFGPLYAIIFAARSSPIVCLVDTLEVFVRIPVYLLQGDSIRKAATKVRWVRTKHWPNETINVLPAPVPVSSSLDDERSTRLARFVIFVLGLMPQALKLLGMKGLLWTQAWAGIYLRSFLTLTFVDVIAEPTQDHAQISQDSQSDANLENVIRLLFRITVIAHFALLFWTLSNFLPPYELLDITEGVSEDNVRALPLVVLLLSSIPFGIMISVCIFVVPLGPPLVLIMILWGISRYFHLDRIMHQAYIRAEAAHPDRLDIVRALSLCLLAVGMFGVPVWFGIRLNEDHQSEIEIFLSLSLEIVKACLAAISSCTVLLCLWLAAWKISSKVAPSWFGSVLEKVSLHVWLAYAFTITNFLLCLMYYCFIYDPTGTVKPAWTEKLG